MALLRAPNFCILITFGLSFLSYYLLQREQRNVLCDVPFLSLSWKYSLFECVNDFLYGGLLGRTKKFFSYIVVSSGEQRIFSLIYEKPYFSLLLADYIFV